MKTRKWRTAACAMLVGTVLTAFAAIAADVGSQADPLVTLSYLNETFMGQLLERVEETLTARNATLKTELEQEISSREQEILRQLGGTAGSTVNTAVVGFTTVTLTKGQTLYGNAGCEVLLRSGSATCYAEGASAPGLVDSTEGTTILHGTALTPNHLYLMTDRRGVTASEAVTLLVRGGYQIS